MTEHALRLSDGAIVLLRRHGNPDGPRLLVSHGTGFAVDGFLRMWQPLAADCDLVLFDLREHGRNPSHDPTAIDGERLTRDMAEIVAGSHLAFGAKPSFGLFHSIAALMALRLESLEPGSFAGLALIEPPATPPAGHPDHAAFDDGRISLATRALKRQARFDSIAELAGKFSGRAAFSHFEPGAGEELAASMLVADGDGYRLACSPAAEARYFETNLDDGLRDRLDAVACPILMLAGGDDLKAGAGPAKVAVELAHLGAFDLTELARTTHMMPLERPRTIAELTRAFMAANGAVLR